MKNYTYKVICSFSMQYTFTEDEVERTGDGGLGEFEPTEKAMTELQKELKEHLGDAYPIDDLAVEANIDGLLGITSSIG